MHNKYSIYSDE